MTPSEPFGPLYPELGAKVAAHRRVHNPTKEQRRAHGEAVIEAILAKQRSELQRATKPARPRCASGTWYQTGEDIIRALQSAQWAKLVRDGAAERKRRTPAEWRQLYDDAMERKRQVTGT